MELTQPGAMSWVLAQILIGTKPLHVWSTTPDAPFAHLGTVTAGSDGGYDLTLFGGAMYTVSTVTTATHGNYTDVPASAPMPLPYHDDFDAYATNDTLPRYFADQGGAFAVVTPGDDSSNVRNNGTSSGTGNGMLVQMMPATAGANAWIHDPAPATLIGDASWSNVTVSVSAMLRPPDGQAHSQHTLVPPPYALVPPRDGKVHGRTGRYGRANTLQGSSTNILVQQCVPNSTYQQWEFNTPYTGYIQNLADKMCLNTYGCGSDSTVIEYSCTVRSQRSLLSSVWLVIVFGMGGRQCKAWSLIMILVSIFLNV